MKHDGIGFTGGFGVCISKCAIAMILNERGIVHVGSFSESILVISKIIAA